MLQLFREVGCVQLDPVQVVAPSHELVLFSRLGRFERRDLETLRWEERKLFEYWAHAASLVLTEDYPLHAFAMRRYATRTLDPTRRIHAWLEANESLRRLALRELRRRGPIPASAIEDLSERPWVSTGWTHGRNVDRMLTYLWLKGTISVAGRVAGRRLWNLSERWFPDWTPRRVLGPKAAVREAAQRALRALGVARARDIVRHFTRNEYPGLLDVLSALERERRIHRVAIRENGKAWPGQWFITAEDLPLLESLDADGDFAPRITLLSPFDNLICDRERTKLCFGFDFRLEIYTPAADRRYGAYAMPILQEDRLIGTVDSALDRRERRLLIRGVRFDQKVGSESVRSVGGAIRDLAGFLGAAMVSVDGSLPRALRRAIEA